LAAAAPLGVGAPEHTGEAAHEPLPDRDRVQADTRVDLLGMTFTQILGVLVHSLARRRVVAAYADELQAIALQRCLQVRAAEMANVLRQLRTEDRPMFSG
jgi:hypothetical protein